MTAQRPFRVVIDLLTPIVDPERRIHLDSLIAWCAVDSARANGTLSDFDSILDNLPLQRHERAEGWVWCASQLIASARKAMRQRYLSRKFWERGYAETFGEGRLIGGRGELLQPTDVKATTPRPKKKELDFAVFKKGAAGGDIDTSRNHQKPASFFYPTVFVPYFEAFGIGDIDRVGELLTTHLQFLGKRSRLGHGQVKAVQVIEDEAALYLWQQRVTPWQSHPSDVRVESRLRPPYWLHHEAGLHWEPRTLSASLLEPNP